MYESVQGHAHAILQQILLVKQIIIKQNWNLSSWFPKTAICLLLPSMYQKIVENWCRNLCEWMYGKLSLVEFHFNGKWAIRIFYRFKEARTMLISSSTNSSSRLSRLVWIWYNDVFYPVIIIVKIRWKMLHRKVMSKRTTYTQPQHLPIFMSSCFTWLKDLICMMILMKQNFNINK